MTGSHYTPIWGKTGGFGIKFGSCLPGHHKNCGLHSVPRPKMQRTSCHLALQAGQHQRGPC